MKSWFWAGFFLLGASWLQIAALNTVLPFRFDFLLLLVVCFSILRDPWEGLIFGLVAGCLEGSLSGGLFLFPFMLSKGAVGFLSGSLRPFLSHHDGVVIMTLVAVATLLQETLLGLSLSFALPPGLSLAAHVFRYLFPLMILHALAAPLLLQATRGVFFKALRP